MPRGLTDDEIKEAVEKEGDIFISAERKKYTLRNGSLSKKEERLVTYNCGLCNAEETRLVDHYKRWGGNCLECRKKEKGENQKVTFEEMKEIIERQTTLKVEGIEDDKIRLTCGEHTFLKSWAAIRLCPWCSQCKKEGVECVKVDMRVKNKGIKKPNVKEDHNCEIPDEYTLIKGFSNNKYLLIKCEDNHVFRVKIGAEIFCPYHNLAIQSTLQAKPQKEVEKLIKLQGDVLNSVYVNDKTLLEIQCGKCNTLFYKNVNNYISKNSRCPECTQKRMLTEKKALLLQRGKDLQEYIELAGWKWEDNYEQYQHNRTIFKVKCPLGHHQKTCQDDFVNGTRGCGECANKSRSIKSRLPLHLVKEICENAGFELLTEKYEGAKNTVHVKCCNCKKVSYEVFEKVRKGRCESCNSSKSCGEIAVRNVLLNHPNVVEFVEEFTFGKDYQEADTSFHCIGTKYLRYDFMAELRNGKSLFIEFDGLQHFEATEFFGGKESFKKRRYHDLIKSSYCYNNNQHLLRISHRNLSHTKQIVESVIEYVMNNKNFPGLQYSNKLDYIEFKERLRLFSPPNNLKK